MRTTDYKYPTWANADIVLLLSPFQVALDLRRYSVLLYCNMYKQSIVWDHFHKIVVIFDGW